MNGTATVATTIPQVPASQATKSQLYTLDSNNHNVKHLSHRTANSDDNSNASGSSSDFVSDEEYAWIPWYCSLKGNEFFCEVDDEYAQDSFNLTGLSSLVHNFEAALDLILDVESSNNDMMSDDQQEQIENDAETLFGLIHARYILTSKGLASMYDKYKNGDFGRCPRVLCDGQLLLPVGLADQPTQHAVKLYCCRCEDVYHPTNPRHQHIDGAYFGSTFPHLLLLTYPELKYDATTKDKAYYIPRVFGFKIHSNAYQLALQDKNKTTTPNNNTTATQVRPTTPQSNSKKKTTAQKAAVE